MISGKIIVCVFIGIFIGLLIYNSDIYLKVFSKLEPDTVSYASTVSRLASIGANFDIFIANPLFGAGLGNYGDLFTAYAKQHFGVHITAEGNSANTIVLIFALYGLLYGLIIVFAFWRLVWHFTNEMKIQIILFLSLILCFSNQSMHYSLLFNTLAFFGLKSETSRINIDIKSQQNNRGRCQFSH